MEEVIEGSEEALMDIKVEEEGLKGSTEVHHQVCRDQGVQAVILEVHLRDQVVIHPTHQAPEATHLPEDQEVSHLRYQAGTLQQDLVATQAQVVATLHLQHQEAILLQPQATLLQLQEAILRQVTPPLPLAIPQQLLATLTTPATLGIMVGPTGPPPHQGMISTAEESPQDPERDPDLLPETLILATKRGVPERDEDLPLPEIAVLLRAERREALEERRGALDVVMTAVSPPEAAERTTPTTRSTLATLVIPVPAVATPCTPATLATPLPLVRMLVEAPPHPLLPLPLLLGILPIRYSARLDELIFQDFLLMTV